MNLLEKKSKRNKLNIRSLCQANFRDDQEQQESLRKADNENNVLVMKFSLVLAGVEMIIGHVGDTADVHFVTRVAQETCPTRQ